MSIQKIEPSFKFNEEQIKQLRQIAPEAFKDNMLDFNSLYEALSDSIEDDEFDFEHFGLMWPGKKDSKKIAALPPRGTLIPIVQEGVDTSTTNNIVIEGENLEVLKLIRKSYANKIKMIYIDPPYNTGEDFIGYFGETDHPIPWQIDHLNCWRTDAANAVEAFTKIVI